MEQDEFERRCQQAVDICGDRLHGIVGRMVAHFRICTAIREWTGTPDPERIPEGLAELYIALMMLRLKYGITQEEIDVALEDCLTLQ